MGIETPAQILMKILIICRQYFPHPFQKEMIDAFMRQAVLSENDILSVFFTGDGVKYCLKDCENETFNSFKKMLTDNTSTEYEYLVCGRALKSLNLEESSLDKHFKISGNMELSSLIAEADKVVEF